VKEMASVLANDWSWSFKYFDFEDEPASESHSLAKLCESCAAIFTNPAVIVDNSVVPEDTSHFTALGNNFGQVLEQAEACELCYLITQQDFLNGQDGSPIPSKEAQLEYFFWAQDDGEIEAIGFGIPSTSETDFSYHFDIPIYKVPGWWLS
jgi:hypothetical protein